VKLIHYRPVSQAEQATKRGIPMRQSKRGLSGVYAVPLLDFPKLVTGNWRRQLRKERNIRLGGIIFEIDDDEMIYFARDWVHTALGERNLVRAREAEGLAFAYARERNTPLTPKQIESVVAMNGCITAYDQPSYNIHCLEIIVPRRILAEEIVSVSLPQSRHGKPRLALDD
jgi:hypothetical protein